MITIDPYRIFPVNNKHENFEAWIVLDKRTNRVWNAIYPSDASAIKAIKKAIKNEKVSILQKQ